MFEIAIKVPFPHHPQFQTDRLNCFICTERENSECVLVKLVLIWIRSLQPEGDINTQRQSLPLNCIPNFSNPHFIRGHWKLKLSFVYKYVTDFCLPVLVFMANAFMSTHTDSIWFSFLIYRWYSSTKQLKITHKPTMHNMDNTAFAETVLPKQRLHLTLLLGQNPTWKSTPNYLFY